VKGFHAVAVGWVVGVFADEDWSLAQEAVNRCPGSCHKKFVHLEDALDFVRI
jgi:viroplasmin and RNaseH domain-containing protein